MLTESHHSGEDTDGNCPYEDIGTPSHRHKMKFNERSSTFFVGDSSEVGPASYFAKKAIKKNWRGERRKQVTASAVRERGTKKHSKVVRFLYSIPTSISDAIQRWVAVPRFQQKQKSVLFGEGELSDTRTQLEQTIRERWEVLTCGRRCADWFIMQRFKITDTIARRFSCKTTKRWNNLTTRDRQVWVFVLSKRCSNRLDSHGPLHPIPPKQW